MDSQLRREREPDLPRRKWRDHLRGRHPTGATLAYDNQGQLGQWLSAPTNPTSSASYLYDGEGNRVQQVTVTGGGTTTTSYLGSLEEVTSDGTTTTTAYYGGLALSVSRIS